jgi:hypothetical protein
MPDQPVARVPLALARHQQGQALVLYALFLLVLLGASALAVDYANWLLIDRRLQNVADHASLAGAAMFEDQFVAGSCAGAGQPQCNDARAQAWASLNEDLNLGLSDADITTLSASDTLVGQTTMPSSGAPFSGGHTIWVTTPPPANSSYQGVGGRYTNNYAVVFVRVDEPTTTYFGRALGLGVRDRVGWATAGPLPTDFALEVFCRNNILPEHGACGGSGATSLVIDGLGGVRLVRGDIGSNESLKVTATNGQGVVVKAGNVFVVEGSSSAALWRCPNGPPSLGGISDGTNGKNAFLMPPQPVPHYQSPITAQTVSDANCTGANATDGCVPYRGAPGDLPTQPSDWTCTTNPAEASSTLPLCGRPVDYDSGAGLPLNGKVRCAAIQPVDDGYYDSDTRHHHMHPVEDTENQSHKFHGHDLGNPQDVFQNLADFTTPTVADSVPNDWVYTNDGDTGTYRTWLGYGESVDLVGKGTLGNPDLGFLYLRWVPFRTIGDGGIDDGSAGVGNQVTISIELDELIGGTWTPVTGATDSVTLTSGAAGPFATREIPIDRTSIGDFSKLSLKFSVNTARSTGTAAVDNRGGAIAWAEIETTPLSPFQPPRIPPGYYHQIHIPENGCAVLDPVGTTFTSTTTGLKTFQLPGIYRFQWDSNLPAIKLDGSTSSGTAGGFLIGDAVTLVFDPFTGPNSGEAIDVGPDGALVLNTMRVNGTIAPCTLTETESLPTYNPSSIDPSDPDATLSLLPSGSVCAAWTVDSTSQSGVHAGQFAWPMCTDPLATCGVDRDRYEETPTPSTYRGITFYFTPAGNTWPATAIGGRFEMGGGSGDQPGIAFRGMLYAPYDDVKISGSNGFNTVGQVLAWTAKFNGGDAYIDLDYPYPTGKARPYLLEPGIGQ